MTIASEITRIKTAIADAYTACQGMGATMPAVMDSDHLDACIQSISVGPTPPQTKKRLVSIAGNSNNIPTIVYTDDGVNWNTTTAGASGSPLWNRVFYGNGKFIATEEATDNFAYSTDGINWTAGVLPTSSYGSSQKRWKIGLHGNNTYLLCSTVDSNTTSVICYSTDGINWSSYATTWKVSGAGFDGEKFILIIYDANSALRYVYSTDGINWSEPQRLSIDAYVSDPTNPHSIKFINNKYYITILAFGGNATVFTSSALNGPWYRIFNVYYTNFQIVTSCVLNNELNLFSGGDFGGTQQAGGYGKILLNTDSGSFIGEGSVPRLNYQGGANVINDRAIVLGYGSDQYTYSTDGTTWSTGTLPASANWLGSCIGEVAI